MESFVITWRELLIVVAVVLAVYIAEMLLLLRSRRSGKPAKNEPGLSEPGISAPGLPEFDRIHEDIEQLRDQLLALKSEIQELRDAPPGDSRALQTPYSQAIQLAKQGVSTAEVAAQCGISRAEAELIVAMHHAKSA